MAQGKTPQIWALFGTRHRPALLWKWHNLTTPQRNTTRTQSLPGFAPAQPSGPRFHAHGSHRRKRGRNPTQPHLARHRHQPGGKTTPTAAQPCDKHPDRPPCPTYGCWCCWPSVGLWAVLHSRIPQQPQGSGEPRGDARLRVAAGSVLGTPGRHSPEQREKGQHFVINPSISRLRFLVSIALTRRLLEDPGCMKVGGLGAVRGRWGLRESLEDAGIHVGCVEDPNLWGLEDSGAVAVCGGLQGPRGEAWRTRICELWGTAGLWGCAEDPTPT